MVAALWPLHVTERDAEALFVRIDWLTQYFPLMLAQWEAQGQPEGDPHATHHH